MKKSKLIGEYRDYYRPVKHANIQKFMDQVDCKEPAIRLYSVQDKEAWNLQVRGPLCVGRAGMTPSTRATIIAGARMNKAQLVELRDAINELLEA